MRYTPNPDAKVDEMLAALGLSSLDDLFADIPTKSVSGVCEELEGRKPSCLFVVTWNGLPKATGRPPTHRFSRGRCYDHHVPAADHLLERSSFDFIPLPTGNQSRDSAKGSSSIRRSSVR